MRSIQLYLLRHNFHMDFFIFYFHTIGTTGFSGQFLLFFFSFEFSSTYNFVHLDFRLHDLVPPSLIRVLGFRSKPSYSCKKLVESFKNSFGVFQCTD